MKASDAIKVLVDLIKEHGDLNLTVYDRDDINGHAADVEITLETVFDVKGEMITSGMAFIASPKYA